MEEELLFRIVFVLIYGFFFVVRGYFRFYKTRKEVTHLVTTDKPIEYGKTAKITIAMFVLGYLISVIVYVLFPELISWAHLTLPIIVRWLGCIIALLTIPLLAWIHTTLGRHYYPDLVVKENHSIETTGPYSRVRHPMYTVLLTFSIGMALISANLLLIGFSLLLMIPFPFLVRHEEQMLLEELGEDYRKYMERTGRFFPQLRKKK